MSAPLPQSTSPNSSPPTAPTLAHSLPASDPQSFEDEDEFDNDDQTAHFAGEFAWFSQSLDEDGDAFGEDVDPPASDASYGIRDSESKAIDSKVEDITYRFAYCAEKAGMAGTMSKVASTITELSRDSAYYKNEERKSAANDAKIAKLRAQVAALPASTIDRAQIAAEKWILDLETSRNLENVIVHLDMDAYYCSVEELDNPALKGKPFGVGGMSMLSTANYEARKYGVRAAMPGYMAQKLCPELIIVPMHFDRYRELSRSIRAILRRYDPNMQPLGLDENYINLTAYLKARGLSDPEPVVQEIRETIQRETKLTASAGISCNKLLSKIGSDINKPNGQFYLPPVRDAILDFMRPLPIRKVWGVGKVSERTLVSLGINTCADVVSKAGLLSLVLSEKGYRFLIPAALGIGSVNVREHTELQKSMSSERTFSPSNTPPERWSEILVHLIDTVIHDLAKHNALTRHVSVKVKTDGFLVRQAGKLLPKYTNVADDLEPVAAALLREAIQAVRQTSAQDSTGPGIGQQQVRLRLIGVKVSELVDEADWKQRGLHRFFDKQQLQQGQEVGGKSAESAVQGHSYILDPSSPSPSSGASSDPGLLLRSATAGATGTDSIPTTCPVCDQHQFPPGADNAVVNAHIDECLTRMQLAEERRLARIKVHEDEVAVPRPDLKRARDEEDPASPVTKRKRKGKERTLHDFFAEH